MRPARVEGIVHGEASHLGGALPRGLRVRHSNFPENRADQNNRLIPSLRMNTLVVVGGGGLEAVRPGPPRDSPGPPDKPGSVLEEDNRNKKDKESYDGRTACQLLSVSRDMFPESRKLAGCYPSHILKIFSILDQDWTGKGRALKIRNAVKPRGRYRDHPSANFFKCNYLENYRDGF